MPVLDQRGDGGFREWVARALWHIYSCGRNVELDARSRERVAEPDLSGERSTSQDGDGEDSDSDRGRGQLDASHSLATRWVLEVPAVIRGGVAPAAGRIRTAAQGHRLLLFENERCHEVEVEISEVLEPKGHQHLIGLVGLASNEVERAAVAAGILEHEIGHGEPSTVRHGDRAFERLDVRVDGKAGRPHLALYRVGASCVGSPARLRCWV